jgi:hypothetical protein
MQQAGQPTGDPSVENEPAGLRPRLADSLQQCHAVTDRATQTLKWVTGNLGILDEVLNHLTLARAALYESILSHISLLGSAWERTAPEAPPNEQGATARDSSNAASEAKPQRQDVPSRESGTESESEIARAVPVPAGRADLGPAPASVRWEPIRQEIEAAVSGLRRAGHMDDIPRALLTRAWLRCLLSNHASQTAGEHETGLSAAWIGPDSAQSDLDEA